MPCRAVARIKIPPTLIRNVLDALERNVAKFEETFGTIEPPVRGRKREEVFEEVYEPQNRY